MCVVHACVFVLFRLSKLHCTSSTTNPFNAIRISFNLQQSRIRCNLYNLFKWGNYNSAFIRYARLHFLLVFLPLSWQGERVKIDLGVVSCSTHKHVLIHTEHLPNPIINAITARSFSTFFHDTLCIDNMMIHVDRMSVFQDPCFQYI